MARNTDESRAIGNRIRQRRTELNMTQEELAHRVGYSGRYSITKIEKGENAMSADIMVKIAKALDVSVTWLAGHPDKTKSDEIRELIERLQPKEQSLIMTMIKTLIEKRGGVFE